MDWLRVALFCSAPDALSQLVKVDPTAPLADVVLLKHRHIVLIRDLPGLDPAASQATGSMIAANIRDLVTKQRAERLETETIQPRK